MKPDYIREEKRESRDLSSYSIARVSVLVALSFILFTWCKKSEDPTTPAVPQTYQIMVIHCTEGENTASR
jgi:hypothetical protein